MVVASSDDPQEILGVLEAQIQGAAVQGIDFPQAAAARNDYPIATVVGSHNAEAARAFVALVLSAEGQRVLTDAGFDAA